MKKTALLVLALLLSFPLLVSAAQDHSMMHMQHGSMDMPADSQGQALPPRVVTLMQMLQRDGSLASTVRTSSDLKTAANATTRVFNVTATTGNGSSSGFGFIWAEVSTTKLNPTVTVNQGDDITINFHSNNSTAHSIIMENYIPRDTPITTKTVTVHFVASQVGSFFYFCDQSLCGIGHGNMVGEFAVTAAPAATPPTISSISPSSGPASGNTSVTISGSNFTSPVQVTFGGVSAISVTFNSSSSITAVAPGGAAGPVEVKVTIADGTSATGTFTYIAAPTITSIAPASGPSTGGSGFVITGTGFQNGVTVKVGGVSVPALTLAGSTSITTTAPAHATGDQPSLAVDVVVTNPDGQSATRSNGFTYTTAPPFVFKADAVFIGSGPVSGGTPVTILGIGFTLGGNQPRAGLAVFFGGVRATNVLAVNDTTLTAVTPPHAAGTVDVLVQESAGQDPVSLSSTAAGAFRFTNGASTGPRKRGARH